MTEDKMQSAYRQQGDFMMKSKYHTILDVVMAALVIGFLFLAYTFAIQRGYSSSILEYSLERDTKCSDAMSTLISNKFTRDDFTSITSTADMKSDRYTELQQMLNGLRNLNSTRYLYTAGRDEDGNLVYLVDGLDLDAEDFAYPGTYIEEEMIPYIESALKGETTYSQDIIDTTWGHIFTACYPVYASDGTGDVIGALCVEIDMEDTYVFLSKSKGRTAGIAVIMVLILIVVTVIIAYIYRKQRETEAVRQHELHEAASRANAANEAKSTFLFNMSHDIRTPMNAILGFAEIGRKNLTNSQKADECFEKIQISGGKMLSILDSVLELSRIESGKTVVEETAVEAGSIMDSCLTMIQPELEKKQLKLSVSKEITHPYVYMDATLITEVILNIVSNSIKYTAVGGSINCSIRQIDDLGDGYTTHEMIFEDTGIGMSKEFQEHIFEAFTRERNSTTSGIEGTGLGMGIVRKIVDMLDGTIGVASAVGVGTTFTIKFPCRIASYEETQPKQAVFEDDEAVLQGKHILLAEDNDLNAEIAIELLEEHGVIVDRAENGVICAEMLEKASDEYYSLILMDVQMPVLDGYSTTKKIRHLANKKKANIPVIAMTANAFAEDKKKALEAGMNDYAAKPIDMGKMIPILLKYI